MASSLLVWPVKLSQNHGLLRALVHATYWLDDGLQAYMRKHAGISLPRAQSMAMVYLTEGVDRPSDLAENLAVSKQATQQVLKALCAKGLVEMQPDPNNGRQKRIVLTAHGRRLRTVAQRGLASLESALADRLSNSKMVGMRRALEADWGAPPNVD